MEFKRSQFNEFFIFQAIKPRITQTAIIVNSSGECSRRFLCALPLESIMGNLSSGTFIRESNEGRYEPFLGWGRSNIGYFKRISKVSVSICVDKVIAFIAIYYNTIFIFFIGYQVSPYYVR